MERFTVYTDILTRRSRFFAAARKSEWLAGDVSKPVDLSDEDLDIFQAYLSCVYVGRKTLREHAEECERQLSKFDVKLCVFPADKLPDESSITRAFEEFGHIKKVTSSSPVYCTVEFVTAEGAATARVHRNGYILDGQRLRVYTSAAYYKDVEEARSGLREIVSVTLIRLYLLADKLQDLVTANMIINELIRFIAKDPEENFPKGAATTLAYNGTPKSSPLRRVLRDYWTHELADRLDPTLIEEQDFPRDFLQDVTMEFMRQFTSVCDGDAPSTCEDKCRYHQHDDDHPPCAT